MDGSVVFARLHQCAPPSTHRPHLSPHPKQHLDWFRHFSIAHGRRSPYFTMLLPSPLKTALVHGDLDCHLIHASSGPPHSASQTASRSVQPFLHRIAEAPYTLQWATLPLKIAPYHGGSGPPSNNGSLGPYEYTTQTASGLVQWFLLTIVTDQQMDHATLSVTIGCTDVLSTAMQPKSVTGFWCFEIQCTLQNQVTSSTQPGYPATGSTSSTLQIHHIARSEQ